jgi:hypothetical protein
MGDEGTRLGLTEIPPIAGASAFPKGREGRGLVLANELAEADHISRKMAARRRVVIREDPQGGERPNSTVVMPP